MTCRKRSQWVDDWRDCWRWFSMRAMFLALTLQAAWAGLPEELRLTLPSGALQGITIALLALGMVGRLHKQEPPQ